MHQNAQILELISLLKGISSIKEGRCDAFATFKDQCLFLLIIPLQNRRSPVCPVVSEVPFENMKSEI